VNQQENHINPSSEHNAPILSAGTAAPDFRLQSAHDTFLGLKDFRDRSLILAFYPADWSAVYGDQMALYNEILPDFNELGDRQLGLGE
jgi:peroxiredoxin